MTTNLADNDSVQIRGLLRHLDAENSHDVAAIARGFAADGVMILNGQTYRGREQIAAVHEGFGFGNKGAFSELSVKEKHRHVGRDAIAVEETVRGKHTGRWEDLEATGRTFELAVCGVYVFNAAGELAEERVYFDGSALMKQLRGG